MTKTTILAGAAAVLAIAAPASLAAPLQARERSDVRGQITVSFSELPNGNHVTNGGQTAVGTVSDSGNIVDAMESAARRGVARTSAEFQRLCAVAIGGLKDMGFTPAQARAILEGARTITNLTGGRVSGADALNASRGLVASGMRYQAQSRSANRDTATCTALAGLSRGRSAIAPPRASRRSPAVSHAPTVSRVAAPRAWPARHTRRISRTTG